MFMLYLMIKEDFNVLCEILVLLLLVQFFNEIYLDTVIEEMIKIFEYFCELQFKENVVFVVKISKSCNKRRGVVYVLGQ